MVYYFDLIEEVLGRIILLGVKKFNDDEPIILILPFESYTYGYISPPTTFEKKGVFKRNYYGY